MQEINWQPSGSIDVLKQRAAIMTDIRLFFTNRGYWEVETPIMAQFGVTDVYLSNIKAIFRNREYCLQTSPEYHMKRLLAAGSGSIFQLSRVFRDDELGRWHNPEFTLLEWYKLQVDHHELIQEVDDFLQLILKSNPLIKKTYQQAFLETCYIDPFTATISQFQEVLKKYDLANVLSPSEQDRDQYLFLLMSHVVEPELGKLDAPVAVYNFPASQAALAKIQNNTAERFEIYYQGVELANGFHELVDANAQAKRFEQDQLQRKQQRLAPVEADQFLLHALTQGLPPCSGVALGIDRLIALALKKSSISEIMSFEVTRA